MSTSTPYFLTTPRLGFRYWSADDLPLALSLWGDPEVSKFIGGPFSPEQIRKRLEEEIDLAAAYKVQYWPVFLLENGEHIGCCGLRSYKLDQKIYEIGAHLRPAFWSQGLGNEAGSAVGAYAFRTLDAEGLFAGHHSGNLVSRHFTEKFGFDFIGEQFYPLTGWEPSYILKRRR